MEEQLPHKLNLNERRQLTMTGVTEVISFDETAVNLLTDCGEMTVEGEGLRIGVLDTERGLVTLEGNAVDGIWYPRAEVGERKGLFGRWRS